MAEEQQQQKSPSLYNNKNPIAVNNNPKETISCSFVLCDICYWCTTYLDKTKLPIDNKCPECYTTTTLSSFPIMPNESFTFDYDEKIGVELKFMHRK